MPYKRKYRKRRPIRRRRKRNGNFNKTLLGKSHAATLKYSDGYSLNAGTPPLVATQVMRCNGIFDPDATGVGHQPRGRDQLQALYDHNTVVGSTITVKFTPAPSATHPLIVGIALKDSSTVEATLNGYLEGRYTSYKVMTLNDHAIVKMNFSTKKYFNAHNIISNSLFRGSAVADPSEQAFFHIFAGSLNASDPTATDCSVVIKYAVVFNEPKNPAQS